MLCLVALTLSAGHFIFKSRAVSREEQDSRAQLGQAVSNKQHLGEQGTFDAAIGHSHRPEGKWPHKEGFHTI